MKTIFKYLFIFSAFSPLYAQVSEDVHTAVVDEDFETGEVYLTEESARIELDLSIVGDALQLYNNPFSREQICSILVKYDIYPEQNLQEHLFLKDLFTKHDREIQITIPNSQSSGGGSGNVNNIVAGISRFLVDRAKKEVNESFFALMYKELDKMAELQFLFPETYYFLKHTQENTLQINLEQLRLKFENDIAQLPFNLYASKDIVDSVRFPFFGKINHYLNTTSNGKWIDLALYAMIENHKNLSFDKLFSVFTQAQQTSQLQDLLQKEEKVGQLNLINSVKFLDLLSRSLRTSNSENNFYYDWDKAEDVLQNPEIFKIYLGLFLAQSQLQPYNIQFYKGDMTAINLKTAVETTYLNSKGLYLDKLQQFFLDSYAIFEKSKTLIQERSYYTPNPTKDYYGYYSLIKESTLLLSRNLAFTNLFGSNFEVEENMLLQYIMPAFDLLSHIKHKNYNLALNDASVLLGSIAKEKKDLAAFLAKFTKYGTLIATVAEAQTSDEVKAAIEAAVLPVGSSRIKRHSRYSLSLNAYVGGFYGMAFYKENVNNINEKREINTFGLMAPIGISFNIGSLGFKKKSALSITAQIVDLGALVNFYAKNGDGAALPAETKIHFGDILAPGVQLSYSIGDSPFSIIGGFQYVANLTRLPEFSTSSSFIPAAYRAQIGLVVDIPLFNLKVWEK